MNLNLSLLFPEWVVLGSFLVLLVSEIFKGKSKPVVETGKSPIHFIWVAIAALGFLAIFLYQQAVGIAFDGMFMMDSFARFFKAFFSLVFVVIVWMSRDYFVGRFEKTGEFLLILWSVLIGLFFLSSANDLLVMFIALEIVTLSFYVLASYTKKEITSIESGLKYLIMGSLASAFMIFGIALVYVVVGSTAFVNVREVFMQSGNNPLLLLGFLFILAGLGFKIAAVPFQLWAPDVYQGAPTPVVAFLAVASKAAGFVLLIRLLFTVFVDFEPHRSLLFSALAILTILYGNLGALLQTNIKRLFGYSSIGHAGYLLIGLAAGTKLGITAILYYFIAYAVTNLAAFFVITLVGREVKSDDISAYTGLAKRSPFLAAAFFVSLLSLAGIPPLAGFFGKFIILMSAVNAGLSWLALVGVIGVPISLYYYLSVVRVMYVEESTDDQKSINVALSSKVIISILVAGIFIVGLWQAPFLEAARQAATIFF